MRGYSSGVFCWLLAHQLVNIGHDCSTQRVFSSMSEYHSFVPVYLSVFVIKSRFGVLVSPCAENVSL